MKILRKALAPNTFGRDARRLSRILLEKIMYLTHPE
jgi:hypothetical protein